MTVKFIRQSQISGLIMIVLATVLLSFKSILTKLAYSEGVSVINLLFYRYCFALPVLLIIAYRVKGMALFQVIRSRSLIISCMIAGFFGYYLATLFDFMSLQLMPASMNRLIVYSYPIYVLIFSAIVQRRVPNKLQVISFLLVQIGLFFVLGGFSLQESSISILGSLFALFSAMSYALYILLNQETVKKIGSVLFTVYALGFSFLYVVIHYGLAFQSHINLGISAKALGIIIVMALFCTALPLLLISEGILRVGATRFALINASGPVLTIGFAVLFLQETLNMSQFLGALFVVLVILYSEIRGFNKIL
jgi:drug/metabolite transporter (DMT)-like permease